MNYEYELEIEYMIGDADGTAIERLEVTEEQFPEIKRFIELMNKCGWLLESPDIYDSEDLTDEEKDFLASVGLDDGYYKSPTNLDLSYIIRSGANNLWFSFEDIHLWKIDGKTKTDIIDEL